MSRVYTFGYIGSRPEDLKAFVDELGAVLVDVRFKAWSRQPRWTGQAIEALVGPDRYLGCPEFGNRNYNSDGPMALADPMAGLRKVAPLLAERPVILLCACARPHECHRTLVADYINYELGTQTVHLPTTYAQWQTRYDGGTRPAEIRCLSLLQPWASMIAYGAKRIETRNWYTPYRGLLAIHASKGFKREYKGLCECAPFNEVLEEAGIKSADDLPTGAVVALCRLEDCIPTERLLPGYPERELGDFSPGRFGWALGKGVRLLEPIPAKGALGVWKPDYDLRNILREVAIDGAL